MSLVGTVAQGVRWRTSLLLAKAAGRLGAVPWRLLWDEVSRRREFVWPQPPIRQLERDEAAGLVLYAFGDERYWLPAGADHAVFAKLYQEVFDAGHPHHYEYAGCRVRSGDTVIDAGACEGFFTRFALQRGARVIAVEPWSLMVAALERTFASEIREGRLILCRAVLSDREGEIDLHVDPRVPFAASVHPGEGPPAASVERVRQTTLATLVSEQADGRCDFVKMDVEGCEREAVRGAGGLLRDPAPSFSVAVYHRPENYTQIRDDLRAAAPDYHVRAKGIVLGPAKVWRPVMLHAWHRGSDRT